MYPYLICIFVNIYGALSATTGVGSILHAIVDSASDEHYKCPLLRSSIYFNQEVLKNCSIDFDHAKSLIDINPSNVESGLCILYYNNFINLCYETNAIDKPLEYTLSDLDTSTVCDILIHNGHLAETAKPGIDTVNLILKKKCQTVCTDKDTWNVKNICSLSAHITQATDDFIKTRDKAKTTEVVNQAQPQNQSATSSSISQENPKVQNLPIVQEAPPISPQVISESPQTVPESPRLPDVEIPVVEKTEKGSGPVLEPLVPQQLEYEHAIPNDSVLPASYKNSLETSINTKANQDSKSPTFKNPEVNYRPPSVDQPAKPLVNEVPEKSASVKTDSAHNKDEIINKPAPLAETDVNKKTITSSSNLPPKDVVDEFVKHPFNDKGAINKEVEEEHAGNLNDGQDEESMKDLKDENDIGFENPPPGDYDNDVSPKFSEVKSKAEIVKSTEKLKPLQTDDDRYTFAANYQNQNIDDSDSYFFSYFMMFCIIFVCAYVAYHNKQKILALIVEGRRGRRPSRTRRPNSANYRKLDSNLEEAVTSTCNKTAPQVIY